MRWRFPEHLTAEEVAQRAATVARIDTWWAAFSDQSEQLSATFRREAAVDVPAFMAASLNAMHAQLCWEFGPALNGQGHRLVITPEHQKDLRPLVDTLIARAPTLPGWEFLAYRPPEPITVVDPTLAGRASGTAKELTFLAQQSDDGRINLQFSGSGSLAEPERTRAAAFVAVETLLGEEVLDHWIGGIDVRPPPSWLDRLLNRGGGAPLSDLSATVQALIAARHAALPDAPYADAVVSATYSLLKLQPAAAPDYGKQADLFVAKTPSVELFNATRSDGFFSGRFSKRDELFCCLKVDGSEGLDDKGFADKAEIEDAMDDLLRPAGLGCFIGGGTGRRYSYVDLVLTDVERALPLVVERLRAGRVPRRSWIQFFDADLRGEWVGIYPESPLPPGLS